MTIVAGQKWWTIGADPECDIVVDVPTISGLHCRIALTETGLILEDLNATNGTFVNDVRVQGSCPVTPEDRVTLGRAVPVPWAQVQAVIASDRPLVPIPAARWLRTFSDVRMMAGAAMAVVILFVAFVMFSGRTPPEPDAGTGEPNTTPDSVVGSGPAPTRSQPPDTGTSDRAETSTSPRAKPGELARAEPSESEHTDRRVLDGASRKPPGPADPTQALYLVLVKDVEEGEVWRLGTAWTVSKHHLVTSASIVKTIEKLKDDFPLAAVWSPDSRKQFSILGSGTKPHAEFEGPFNEAQTAKREFETLQGELEAKLEDANRQEAETKKVETADEDLGALKKLKKELIEWDARVIEAEERANYYDIGILEVKETMTVVLPMVSPNIEPHGNDRVKVFGIPFPTTDLQMGPDDIIQASFLDGHIRRLPVLNKQSRRPLRLQISTESVCLDRGQDEEFSYEWWNWVGSPVLNAEGQVIAVYSRLTPSLAEPSKPPDGEQHDAVFVRRVHELISGTQ